MTTTSTLPQIPLPMYADTAIHFRDPFAHDTRRAAQIEHSGTRHRAHTTRGLAQTFDMNGISQHTRPSNRLQEHGSASYHGERMQYQQAHARPAGSYMPPQVPNTDFGRYGPAQGTSSRGMSPNLPVVKPGTHDSQSQPQSRRGSQANTIAPSFQIPRSVNDSGGSLAELAAQVG